MTKAGLGKSAEARIEYWRARIGEQERSGMAVGRFCQEQQITEQSFYVWRKRLRQQEAVRFALVEAPEQRQQPQRRSQCWNWC